MRHTLYEDPSTHRFAMIRLPWAHIEGDEVPIPPTARWFATREDAPAHHWVAEHRLARAHDARR